jgi:orotate phosphoribosyltransferase
VGAPLVGRVLVIDDVLTAGTAVRESLALIRAHGATPAGVVIALDRQERGQGMLSAAQELTREHGLPVLSIAGLREIMDYASSQPELAAISDELATYRAQYGVD